MRALIILLLMVGVTQATAQTAPAATTPGATTPGATTVPAAVQPPPPVPGQPVSDAQKNSNFIQDQRTKEVYQQQQVQVLTDKQLPTPATQIGQPTPTATASAEQQAQQQPAQAPVQQPLPLAAQTVVTAPIEGTVVTTTAAGQTVAAPLTLPITKEQSESPDFPLNAGAELVPVGPLVVSEPLPAGIVSEEEAVRQTVMRTQPVYIVKQPDRGPAAFEKRTELRSLTPAIAWQKEILDNARSVAIMIEKDKLHAVTDSIYQLDVGITLGQRFKLCPGTPFINQPVIGLGTAFILAKQTMVTAGHVFQEDLSRYVVVFGFEMVNKAGAYEGLIPLKDIYYPTRVLQNSETLDITIFEVSRPLERPALKYSKVKLPRLFTPIYMIGHPYGLPAKVALNASVQSNGSAEFFYTSLFAAQGNSGSPVFDFRTNEVVGVLVSGEVDYNWNGGCNAPKTCGIPYCKGEKVVSIASVPHINSFITGEPD